VKMDWPEGEPITNTADQFPFTHSNGCLESENNTECSTPFTQRLETYIVPVIFGLIFMVGVTGNITLIYIFLKNKTTRTVPNM